MTYFLMVWGNGLGSEGDPFAQYGVMLEWGNRVITVTTFIFLALTLYRVFTSSHRSDLSLKRSGKLLLTLVGIQIFMGGVSTFIGKSPVASTVQLIVATLAFGAMINLACVITWSSPTVKNPDPKVRKLATVGLVAILIQFCIGAAVKHTQSGLACPNFPQCMEGFFPIPFTFGSAVAFLHRWWGVLMLGLFIHLALTTAKTTPSLAGPTRRAFALSMAQIFLGIGTVMSGLSIQSRIIHAAVGYAICGLLFYVAIRSGGLHWFRERKAS